MFRCWMQKRHLTPGKIFTSILLFVSSEQKSSFNFERETSDLKTKKQLTVRPTAGKICCFHFQNTTFTKFRQGILMFVYCVFSLNNLKTNCPSINCFSPPGSHLWAQHNPTGPIICVFVRGNHNFFELFFSPIWAASLT